MPPCAWQILMKLLCPGRLCGMKAYVLTDTQPTCTCRCITACNPPDPEGSRVMPLPPVGMAIYAPPPSDPTGAAKVVMV